MGMKKHILNSFVLFGVMVLFPSCATLTKSTLLGVGVGAVSGGLIGTAIASGSRHQVGSALVGGAVGAATGGLIGALVYKSKENSSLLSKDKLLGINDKVPFLTSPEVRKIRVPDKIEGNKYIEGHNVYILERQSVWSEE